MLQKLFKLKFRIIFGSIMLVLLISVRIFEHQLFYDPFLDYFKSNFQNTSLPQFDSLQLFFGLLFRYSLNSVISLSIIYAIFNDASILRFSSILYLVFFIILKIRVELKIDGCRKIVIC